MYTINILKSSEFDRLPRSITKGSDVSTYLGFADPSTGNCYVRNTNIPELNQYLVNHELEHLVSSPNTHVNAEGLCCKDFGSMFGRRPKQPDNSRFWSENGNNFMQTPGHPIMQKWSPKLMASNPSYFDPSKYRQVSKDQQLNSYFNPAAVSPNFNWGETSKPSFSGTSPKFRSGPGDINSPESLARFSPGFSGNSGMSGASGVSGLGGGALGGFTGAK